MFMDEQVDFFLSLSLSLSLSIRRALHSNMCLNDRPSTYSFRVRSPTLSKNYFKWNNLLLNKELHASYVYTS